MLHRYETEVKFMITILNDKQNFHGENNDQCYVVYCCLCIMRNW